MKEKAYMLIWDEREVNQDGDTLGLVEKKQTIMAASEDEACAQWEKENEHNEYQNGLTDCFEIVKHPLFQKHLIVPMPDGFDYLIPIEFIARHRAEHFDKNFGGNRSLSLTQDTLPLFEKDESQIHIWAKNITWDEIQMHSYAAVPKVNKEEMQKAWINSSAKIQ